MTCAKTGYRRTAPLPPRAAAPVVTQGQGRNDPAEEGGEKQHHNKRTRKQTRRLVVGAMFSFFLFSFSCVGGADGLSVLVGQVLS